MPRPELRPERLTAKIWKNVLLFLEIIGLRTERNIDEELELARFKLYHTEFRKLLSANHSFLATVAELESQDQPDQAYLKRRAVRAVADIHAMIQSLNTIAPGRYSGLMPVFHQITAELTAILQDQVQTLSEVLVLDLADIRPNQADLVGGKMANLAVLANTLGFKTPDGFAITTDAYWVLVHEGGLRSWIEACLLDLTMGTAKNEVCDRLIEGIYEAEPPARLRDVLYAAHDRLMARLGRDVLVAVRSSAVGEDSRLTFAGQFRSVLNVPRDGLERAYVDVLASLYSPDAVLYRSMHGLPQETAEMAVGVIAQVPARVSGVIFTQDPVRPYAGQVLIQAVRGLGVSLVDGRTSPEAILINRNGPAPSLHRTPAAQSTQVVIGPAGGTREETIPPELAGENLLTDDEARALAEAAMKIEAHYNGPQDIEWAMAEDRQVYFLQTRPLRLADPARDREPPLAGYTVLVAGGETACPGTGVGLAVHLSENDNLESFPDQAVLVTRRPSPRFVQVLGKARAIVTDFGSTTGHMASLAREFRVPTLLNTKTATKAIAPGTVVTVDADGGYVYAGKVPVPTLLPPPTRDRTSSSPVEAARGSQEEVDRVSSLILTLTLTEPNAPEFSPEHARTLHDLARYIHEKSYEAMFGLGEKMGDMRHSSYLLDVFLPLDLYLIDLGGGLALPPRNKKVKPRHVISAPMKAILNGMLDKRLPRFGARPIDVGGLLSVMARHATENPESDPSFRAPSYALISANYANFAARVGYHFSVVDTYCGFTPNKNYISFLFRGGAADAYRRNRRARTIAAILTEYGFAVRVERDAVHARVNRTTRDDTVAHLEMIGRLLQFFRQMDAAMTSENAVIWVRDAFLRGDYDLNRLAATSPAVPAK